MKRILILTASFGEGHNAAARNLRDALLHTSGGKVIVEVVDLFAQSMPRANSLCRSLYLSGINRAPSIWNAAYRFVDNTRFIHRNLYLFSSAIHRLRQILEEEKPVAVCCTYPLFTAFLEKIRQTGGPHLPELTLTIVTDSITINSIWYATQPDLFIVPNPETAEVLVDAGISPRKILEHGFPVPLTFTLPGEQPVLHPPGPENPPSILYMGNSLPHLSPKIIETLLAHENWHITAAIGRDETLIQSLRDTFSTAVEQGRLTLLGWAKNMPRLIMSHHFVIGKAGGATVQETIAARTPLIVTQIVPGQEEGNYTLLQRHDCAALATTPAAIADTIATALKDDAHGWHAWRARLETLSRPDAALRTADYLLQRTHATQHY